MGVMLTITIVFIILFLLYLWVQGTPWQFSKQISKLSFQLSFQIFSLLTQTEGERKAFLERVKKGGHIVRLSPRALDWYIRWKSLLCEIWNNPTPPLFFFRPPYKKALQNMEFYNKFVDRFQDLSKVKNPAVSKAKVW